MAKKTLLSESQVSKFMKLANIKSDKINGFKKRLNENYGMGGTVPMPEMEEDEEAADAGPSDVGDDMGTGMEADEMDMDMEPDAPEGGGDIEIESDELGKLLAPMIKSAVMDALAEAGVTSDGGDEMGDMDLESDEMTDEDEGGMEDEGDMDMEEEDEGEEEEEEEEELQEAKKKAMKADKKTRNLEGGDAKKKMKESLAFDNVDLVTDDEVINEVLKRVIRRIV
jgi:hypothetical protein